VNSAITTSEFALRVAREDQRIEGLPLNPIAVEPFVQANATNSLATLQAERVLSVRFAEIEKLIASEKKQTDRLIAIGETHEENQNRTRAHWAKWIGSSSVLIGGLVALCILVPAAISDSRQNSWLDCLKNSGASRWSRRGER
jgi:hypothetical protein